jgi:TPR repeat protein
MIELAITINDGIRDANGRILVRRNAPYAFRLLRRAVESGDESAAGSLGYAYNVGQGTKRNVAQAIGWYRRAARSGDSTATSNLATVYRDAGKAGLAFQWWKRAADMRDGDAAVDVGYCYQYGIGTRKNTANAKRLFGRANWVDPEVSRSAQSGLAARIGGPAGAPGASLVPAARQPRSA